MKKHLLGALLVLGSTSFGAVTVPVESTTASATLPIKVVGKVLDSCTKKVLVVTPLKNAGVNGGSLEFDFGDLVASQTQQLEGTYKVEVLQNGAQVALTTPPTSSLVGSTAVGSDNKKAVVNLATGNQTEADDVSLTYTLSSLAKQSDKSYAGTLTVDAEVKSNADAGTFTDRTIGIKVDVTGLSA